MKRPENLEYSLDETPPFNKLAVLSLQMVVMASLPLVMVIILVQKAGVDHHQEQSIISLALIALGLATLIQVAKVGPIGSGHLAPLVPSAIYLQASLGAVIMGGLPLVFGMTIVAGVFEVIFSRLLRQLRFLFPTVVVGLIVVAVGLQLGLVGVRELLNVGEGLVGSRLATHVFVCGLTLSTMISLAVWGKGLMRLLASLIGLVVGTVVAVAAGFVGSKHAEAFYDAPIFGLPSLSHISYSFELQLLAPFLVCGLAAGIRAVGAITTCQRINDADWKYADSDNISRGVAADGVGCATAGLLGVSGFSIAPSLIGLSETTGVTSRVVGYAMTVWFLLFACMPKLSAGFVSLPQNVLGSALVFTGSLILMAGIKLVSSRKLDLRDTLIVGIPLFLGLSREVFPTYYEALPPSMKSVTDSMLTIVTLSAIVLNLLLRIGQSKTDEVTLETESEEPQALKEALKRDAASWGMPESVASRAICTLQRLIDKVYDDHLADGPVKVRLTYDKASFIIELSYSGEALALFSKRAAQSGDYFEEMPIAVGLELYLEDLCPDELKVQGEDENYKIKLVFYCG